MKVRRLILKREMPHRVATLLLSLAWIGPAAFAPVHVLRAEEPDTNVKKTTQGNYGRTPDTVIPYREFHEPYVRFFQEVTAFRGYGRDAKTADLPETARIGVLAPTGSAPDADLGQEMIDGITLAIEQANADGGYQGIPFETVLREDAGLWGGTANEMVAFKFQDDVVGVLGSIDGANTHIALRVALKAQMPMFNTATTDPTLTETAIPWLMRCMADDRQQGYALAHHIFSKCEIKKVAALRVNDRYGRMGIAEFRDAARRLKHPLRVELRWDRGDRDFSKQLDRIAQSGAEAVVLWGNAEDTAAVVREMRRRNMPQLIFGCDRLVSRRFLEEAEETANGVVAVATYNPTAPNPRYTEFLKVFQKRFDREPDSFAAHAYDGANILIETIRKGGLNRIRVRDALHEYDSYAGVTGLIEFDTTLNDIGSVYIATVTEGAYVYELADFAKSARSAQRTIPYRTLAESPPVARVAQVSDTDRIPEAFRIGCFLPHDPTGKSVVRGLRMALAQVDTLPGEVPIELIVRDSRGVWGDNSNALTSLVADEDVLALIGSTERRGTHLMETMVAKLHMPLITLCGDDPTIHAIPLPWIFSVAPAGEIVDEDFARRFELQYGSEATKEAAMGYDAGQLLLSAIRGGGTTRAGLRKQLATAVCRECVSGSFRFDALGRRVDLSDVTRMATLEETNSVIGMTRVDKGREGSP